MSISKDNVEILSSFIVAIGLFGFYFAVFLDFEAAMERAGESTACQQTVGTSPIPQEP